MQLIKEVYTSWQAEVVFITSNLQGNQEMMEGCKEAGIPAFVCRLISHDRLVGSTFRQGNTLGFLSILLALFGSGHRWNQLSCHVPLFYRKLYIRRLTYHCYLNSVTVIDLVLHEGLVIVAILLSFS